MSTRAKDAAPIDNSLPPDVAELQKPASDVEVPEQAAAVGASYALGTRPVEELTEQVLNKLSQNQPVRFKLAGGGRLLIEQQVPFLCVYTEPAHGVSSLRRWVTGELAAMVIPAEPRWQEHYRPLLRAVVQYLAQRFGSFLLLELRLAEPGASASMKTGAAPGTYKDVAEQVHISLQDLGEPPSPRFRLCSTARMLRAPILSSLTEELQKLSLMKKPAQVEQVVCQRWSLMGLRSSELQAMSCTGLLLELEHPYVWGAHELASWRELRPFLRDLMRGVKRTFFQFSRKYTPFDPPHYLALGRRSLVKVVRQIDVALAEVNRQFDFLLHVTPVNVAAAWAEFRRSKFSQTPQFLYRPLGFEPHLLKRELYNIPIENVDDPTLAHLFLEKQEQLDRQITMLWDRNSPRFLHEGLQLFGNISDTLLQQAYALLDLISPRSRGEPLRENVEPGVLAVRAREEIERYRKRWEGFSVQVHIRSDVAGILVSQGDLLIADKAVIPASRIESLVHHEIGTHCLTAANGSQQPLSLLGHGLAGYEGLQEGLAVLAEFLCGGLQLPRLRTLAGRVVAAHSVVNRATFLDTYQLLHQTYHFTLQTAFTIAMRVHRGGGFVKDMVYLKGFIQLLEFLQHEQELEPLYVGKLGMKHIPLVRELLWRKVLEPPKLLPFFLETEEAKQRLQQIRGGLSILDLATYLA